MSSRALLAAFGLLIRHPLSLLLAYAVPLLIAAPLAAMMADTLTVAGANGYPTPLSRGAIDVDRWTRVAETPMALAQEFLPQTLGFAAALDTVSAVVEGPRPHSLVIVGAVILHWAAWALLWPVLLTRWAATRPPGISSAVAAARRFAPVMFAVSIAAALAALVLYVTLQPLLIDVVFPWIAAGADSQAALMLRALCYFPLVVSLVVLSATAALARADAVVRGPHAWRQHVGNALRRIRQRWLTVVVISSVLLVMHLVLLVGYGAGEILGGHRVGGWRAVAVAQLYVAGRVVLRLLWAGAFLNLSLHEFRPASR